MSWQKRTIHRSERRCSEQDRARGPDSQGQRIPRRDHDLSLGSATICRQTDRPGRRALPIRRPSRSRSPLVRRLQKRTQELTESFRQQTATADALKVISRSAFDLQTVLDTLLQTAARLCEADQGTITQRKGGHVLSLGVLWVPARFCRVRKRSPGRARTRYRTGRALVEGRVIHIPDVEADPDYTWKRRRSSADSAHCSASRCSVKACRWAC